MTQIKKLKPLILKKLFVISVCTVSLCASSNAQTFTVYPNNPVVDTLQTNASSEFWTRWKSDPCIIHWDTDSLRMYYGTNNYGVSTQIGTAVSADGNNWIEKTDAPVLSLGSQGSWDDTEVETPYVIYIPTNPDSMKYMMWYAGATPDSNLFDTVCLGFPIYQIGLAYSDDGLNWTKYNNPANDSVPLFAESDPVLTIPSWTNCNPDVVNEKIFSVAEPCVLYEGGTYKMYHIGFGCSTPFCLPQEDLRYRVLYSESTDGINWEPFSVLMDVGNSTAFDSKVVYSPDVIKVGSEYLMFYAGGTDTTLNVWNCDMGLATSIDGINFTKNPNNPVITRVASSWIDYGMNAASSIIFLDTLRVYYSGLTLTPNIMPAIGYSFLDSLLITSINEATIDKIQVRAYPNPFKNFSILEFENPKNEKHTLTLYDTQGRQVLTITDITTNRVEIDRTNLTSGLYFFQLHNDRQVRATGKLTIE